MTDFTSSLYLDMKHRSSELLEWNQLTIGVPAALYETIQSRQISKSIAQMQGLEAAVLSPSTLHVYWDLYGYLSKQQIVVFIDEKVYPVSRYGIERLTVKGIPVYYFRHQSTNHLAQLLNQKLPKRSAPVIITDGWCTACGKPAPIKHYADLVNSFNGKVIIDDTQAFGILGERQQATAYGIGGGGILRWLNINNPCIVTITSLAKGFGVPMAVIGGNRQFISEFINNSNTRIYSSPVSIANLYAAMNALSINSKNGDERRRSLLNNVIRLKSIINELGMELTGGLFPVQTVSNLSPDQSVMLHKRLQVAGIKTVLVTGHKKQCPAVCFILRSDHTLNDFKKLLSSINNTGSFQTAKKL